MTTLMAKAAEMAEVVLIQEPPVRWVPDEAGGGVEQRDERSGERRVRERYERWRRGGGCEGRNGEEGIQGDESRRRPRRDAEGTNRSSSERGQRTRLGGKWEIGIRDNNFLWVCSDGSSRIRSLIGIKRGVRWRDYGGLRHRDIVSVELLPNIGPAVRIFNVYNRNTLASVNLLNELQDAHPWIVAGDMNAHHPSWSRADREPSEDWRNVLPIVNAGTSAFEPGTVTRIGSTGQRSSTIDLVISGPGHGIDGLEATIADDLRTGSDHEVLSWELFSTDRGLADNIYDSETPAWKLRPPIKSDDQDELEEWRVKWQSGYAPFEDPMIEIKRFTRFLMMNSEESDGAHTQSVGGTIN
jgi:hypothetical protein